MAAASELPTELATRPLGLTALTGLDINQKPLHKAIWESFSVNRHPERVPLSFRLLPIDHEFPKARQDKTRQVYFTRVAQSAARLVSFGALGSIKITYKHLQ